MLSSRRAAHCRSVSLLVSTGLLRSLDSLRHCERCCVFSRLAARRSRSPNGCCWSMSANFASLLSTICHDDEARPPIVRSPRSLPGQPASVDCCSCVRPSNVRAGSGVNKLLHGRSRLPENIDQVVVVVVRVKLAAKDTDPRDDAHRWLIGLVSISCRSLIHKATCH
jgi:hypothetical protein